MRKKRVWYSKDNEPLIVTKKGKHRWLINPRTGEVIAHNPLPLIPLAMMAAPHAAKAIGGFVRGREEAKQLAEERKGPSGIPTYIRPRRMTSEERLVKLIQAEKMLR